MSSMAWLALLAACALCPGAQTRQSSVHLSWAQELLQEDLDLESCAGTAEMPGPFASAQGRRRPKLSYTDEEVLRILEPLFAKIPAAATPPRRARSGSTAAGIIVVFLWFLVFLFLLGACCQQKAGKRTKPSSSLVQRWAGDLSDVFLVFPWMGLMAVVNKLVVAPIVSIQSLADDFRTAQKLRLQRQLLEEGGEDARRQLRSGAGAAKGRERAGSGGGSSAPAKAKRKVTQAPREKLKEPERKYSGASSATQPTSPMVEAQAQPAEDEVLAAAQAELPEAEDVQENLTEWCHVQREHHSRRGSGKAERSNCGSSQSPKEFKNRRRASDAERQNQPAGDGKGLQAERPEAARSETQRSRAPKSSATSSAAAAASGSPAAPPRTGKAAKSAVHAPPPPARPANPPQRASPRRDEEQPQNIEDDYRPPSPITAPPPPPPPPPPAQPAPADPGRELLQLLRQPPQQRRPSTPPMVFNDTGCISGGTGGTEGAGYFSGWHPEEATAAMSSAQPASKGAAEDDVGLRLEAMVEELAGINSFELLEDAFSKVDAAREALSKVVSDSGLQHSAPAFVPGEMWTGTQRSSFVD